MRSTFNVLFYIKRNEPKKDGRVVIMVRITINGVRSQLKEMSLGAIDKFISPARRTGTYHHFLF